MRFLNICALSPFGVVLVEPLHSVNVGSVARVMKNLGFSELVLMNPCELEIQARLMSVHSYDIIEKAKIEFFFEDAVKGSDTIVGTTGLPGITENEHMRMPAFAPRKYELSDIGSGKLHLVDHSDIELLYEYIDEVLSDIEYKEHKEGPSITSLQLERLQALNNGAKARITLLEPRKFTAAQPGNNRL